MSEVLLAPKNNNFVINETSCGWTLNYGTETKKTNFIRNATYGSVILARKNLGKRYKYILFMSH